MSFGIEKWKLRRVMARLIPMSRVMGAETRIVCCPFHDDNNPSAKLYDDPDGEHLYCFYCKKQFSSYDYVTRILQLEPERYLREKVAEEAIVVTLREVEKEAVPREPFNFQPAIDAWGRSNEISDLVIKIYSE